LIETIKWQLELGSLVSVPGGFRVPALSSGLYCCLFAVKVIRSDQRHNVDSAYANFNTAAVV
jgi:hypothetical protein